MEEELGPNPKIFNNSIMAPLYSQVAACWTDVRLLLVDDFVRVGFEQMLLLFEEIDLAQGILGRFLLTDLCGVHYSVSYHHHLITHEFMLNNNYVLM